ncbi:hypothetical protein JXA27_06485 [Aerococcaceae bacterium zg-B36]|uniref:hypothetical protein n=1 Tax=Aerococcaceae bacterium zg-252 TaxID=2796928 RepID=UPI001BD8398C|nr:hypothetical protein [Aerococcaceae bacterium zg-B36]
MNKQVSSIKKQAITNNESYSLFYIKLADMPTIKKKKNKKQKAKSKNKKQKKKKGTKNMLNLIKIFRNYEVNGDDRNAYTLVYADSTEYNCNHLMMITELQLQLDDLVEFEVISKSQAWDLRNDWLYFNELASDLADSLEE